MGVTSNTGLIESVRRPIRRYNQSRVQLKAISSPAPLALRPFSGVYNPFSYGCSVLCNHPADSEARHILKQAKDSWALIGKAIVPPDDVAAIREHLQAKKLPGDLHETEDAVPEELFRRYTDTDSRPLTPAPTVASIRTRGSGTRRCVTPDPSAQQRPKLILDLRRSHSQETLCWNVVTNLSETDLHLDQPVLTPVPKWTPPVGKTPSTERKPEPKVKKLPSQQNIIPTPIPIPDTLPLEGGDTVLFEEPEVRRRGKKRKPRAVTTVFTGNQDPETQVSTLGPDSHNPSARPSLIPNGGKHEENGDEDKYASGVMSVRRSLIYLEDAKLYKSCLEPDILKHLARQLTQEVVEAEFVKNRQLALIETLRVMKEINKMDDSEVVLKIKQEMNLPPAEGDAWLSLPRTFSRRAARFELPLDWRTLKTMTPLQYLSQHVVISKGRIQLYNRVFAKFIVEAPVVIKEDKYDEENKKASAEFVPRWMFGKDLDEAVVLMMGGTFSAEKCEKFKSLVGWKDDDVIDFRTWAGISALCERIAGPLPSKINDPREEIEVADFELLSRILTGVKADSRLVEILHLIRSM